eukprot:EG_transcript_6644
MVKPGAKDRAARRRKALASLPRVEEAFLSDAPFASLGLHPATLQVLGEELAMQEMSAVQAACLPDALKGRDLLVQAKTGTGKTLCFLLPIVERLLPALPTLPDRSIFALIVTPTRELAQQIHLHGLPLFRAHRLKIHAAVGGTSIDSCREHCVGYHGTCHAVVATPGRILDHLKLLELVRKAVRALQVLVLDEVDQLLAPDFWVHLRPLLAFLPGCDRRQTMLFSATLSVRVNRLAATLTRPDHLATVQMTAASEANVHHDVPQEVVVVPIALCAFSLLTLLRQAQAVPRHKVIVFFNTTCLTECMARLFRHVGVDALEMFGRKKPAVREAVSHQFRTQSDVVMFTSDVSARGMDYPDVTCVIQVGMASSKEQYIHRLGRTARAGKQGRCYLLLMDFERPFLDVLQDLGAQPIPLPLPPDAGAQIAELHAATSNFGAARGSDCHALYSAFLAFYGGQGCHNVLRLPRAALAAAGAEFTTTLFGLPAPADGGAYSAEELGLQQMKAQKKTHFSNRRRAKPERGPKPPGREKSAAVAPRGRAARGPKADRKGKLGRKRFGGAFRRRRR